MVIVATKSGRLANRLFLYAHFIAWAIENRRPLANITMDEYAEFFVNLRSDLLCRYPPRASKPPSSKRARRSLYLLWLALRPVQGGPSRLARALKPLAPSQTIRRFVRKVAIRALYVLEPLKRLLWMVSRSLGWADVIKIEKDESLTLDASFTSRVSRHRWVFTEGWLFRNEELVLAHREAIRDFFQPVRSVVKSVDAVIARARDQCDVLVGVHIRRGDYEHWEAGRYYFNDEDYLGIMRRIRSELAGRRVCFLVCSDETPEPELFSEFHVEFGSGQFVEDLYALAECDLLTGPPSTFSRWAAYVGNPRQRVMLTADDNFSIDEFKFYAEGAPPLLSDSL